MYRPPTKYSLSRRNELYYNPWATSDFIPSTPPLGSRSRRPLRTLEQMSLRRSMELGLPIPNLFPPRRIAATRIQSSFQNYWDRSENAQCVEVLANCYKYTKKRIVDCLVQFMEYLLYSGDDIVGAQSIEIYDDIFRNIVNYASRNSIFGGNDELIQIAERSTNLEMLRFLKRSLFGLSKTDLQNLIDNTILRHISPTVYYT